MQLPYDRELNHPESLLEWVNELDVKLDIREIEGYPKRPLIFSEYRLAGPTIIIYRYLPLEDWLNMLAQHQTGFYGPWYYLHLAHQFYFHLEASGEYEIERGFFNQLTGSLSTIDERACLFTKRVLGTLHNPAKFYEMVEQSFKPQTWDVDKVIRT